MTKKQAQNLLEAALCGRLDTILCELKFAALAALERVAKTADTHAECGPVDLSLLEMQCLDEEIELHEALNRWLAYAPARLVEDELSGILLQFAEGEAQAVQASFDTSPPDKDPGGIDADRKRGILRQNREAA